MIDFEEQLKQIKDKRVILLQSGGLDSCYLACLLSKEGFKIHHLFVDYGQNAKNGELLKAKEIVKTYGGELHIVTIDLPWLKDSTVLCGHQVESYTDTKVPNDNMGTVFLRTYVPMRNHLLLSIAASLAESLEIKYIASALDGNEDYYGNPLSSAPDKHPSFVKAIEYSLSEGSSLYHQKETPFELITPLLGNSKENTISQGIEIGCDFSHSISCYNVSDEGKPCGKCCACLDRLEHFKNVGIKDPLL